MDKEEAFLNLRINTLRWIDDRQKEEKSRPMKLEQNRMTKWMDKTQKMNLGV